jgi:hypothetical protein
MLGFWCNFLKGPTYMKRKLISLTIVLAAAIAPAIAFAIALDPMHFCGMLMC